MLMRGKRKRFIFFSMHAVFTAENKGERECHAGESARKRETKAVRIVVDKNKFHAHINHFRFSFSAATLSSPNPFKIFKSLTQHPLVRILGATQVGVEMVNVLSPSCAM